MSKIEIEILNWDKYNPRKDLANMPWFRVQSDIGFSEKMFELSPSQKWFFIFLLSCAARNNGAKVKSSLKFMSHHSGLSEMDTIQAIEILKDERLIEHSPIESRTEPVRVTDDVVPNRTEQNRTEQNNCSAVPEPSVEVFDFEIVYSAYPRKEGKKRGMKKIVSTVKTAKKYELFKDASRNYIRLCRSENRDKTKIMHFATFANNWEDYLDAEVGADIPDKVKPLKTRIELAFGKCRDFMSKEEYEEINKDFSEDELSLINNVGGFVQISKMQSCDKNQVYKAIGA